MEPERKRGRQQLAEGHLSADQRRIRVGQLDWPLLERCFKQDTGDRSATLFKSHGGLSGDAVSRILERYIFLCSEEGKKGKKRLSAPPRLPDEEEEPEDTVARALAKSPLFQHAVISVRSELLQRAPRLPPKAARHASPVHAHLETQSEACGRGTTG